MIHPPRSAEHCTKSNGIVLPAHSKRRVRLIAPVRLLVRLLLSLFLALMPAGAQPQTEEYRVKAAFLFHFAQLVDWPSDSLGDDKNPLTFCTFGKDPFQGDLDATLQGKSIGSRSLRVRHLKQAQEIQGCQILFLGEGERDQLVPLLAAMKRDAILTVGETDGFVKQGGMIGFCLENSKVRFDVNVDAAARAKLKISSRLLLLAKNVIGNRE